MSGLRRPSLEVLDALLRDPSPEPHYAEPCGPADEELEWFFTMEESSLGLRSNFEDALRIQRHRRDRSDSFHVAARVRRIILERLRRMGDPDAGVLEAAYAPRPWPGPLLDELGRLTGVVVRLATRKVGVLRARDRPRVEEEVARALVDSFKKEGGAELACLREWAETYFDHAYGAYRQQRGTSANLVRRFR